MAFREVEDFAAPSGLLADDYPVQTEEDILVSGQTLTAGAVLGRITATGKLTLHSKDAGDGSETARAVLVHDADASGGDLAVSVYSSGCFVFSALSVGANVTQSSLKLDFEGTPLFVKEAI